MITRTDDDPFGMQGLAHAPAWPGTPEHGTWIEAQEAIGQRELVESTDLPTDTGGRDDEFIALGFTFGEPHASDPLFRPSTLPQGWTKAATDHSMGSVIRDEKGRERISIFYKAAWYDRSATMTLLHPAYRLMQMIYGDDEPTSVPVDELLSADEARAYLDRERAEAVEYLALGLDRQPKIDRIDAMLALLPTGDES